MDCSLPGSSIHGIFQARIILEWVAISFSRGSFWPRDWTQVSLIVGRCFTIWATREVLADRGNSWLVDMVEGKGKMKDASYFLSRTQPMKSHGLLFTIALPAFFFNLHYLKFFSSMSYSFQSTGLSPHWLNLFLDTFDFFLFN